MTANMLHCTFNGHPFCKKSQYYPSWAHHIIKMPRPSEEWTGPLTKIRIAFILRVRRLVVKGIIYLTLAKSFLKLATKNFSRAGCHLNTSALSFRTYRIEIGRI